MARKEIRRFFRDMVVNRFGGYIKIFYLAKQARYRKKEFEQPTWVRLAGVPWCLVPTRVTFLVVYYFPNFLNIPKLTKNIFADFSESVYLPYHIPPYFHDSGVFWKDSFICASSVKVWVILLSTLMGVLEI